MPKLPKMGICDLNMCLRNKPNFYGAILQPRKSGWHQFLCVTNSIFCVWTSCFAGIQRSMLSNGKCSESLRKCGKKKLRNFFLHIKFDTLLDFCPNTYLGHKCPFLGVWAWYFTCSLILWPSKVVHAKSWTWGTQKLMPARLPGLQNSTIKVRFVAQTHI